MKHENVGKSNGWDHVEEPKMAIDHFLPVVNLSNKHHHIQEVAHSGRVPTSYISATLSRLWSNLEDFIQHCHQGEECHSQGSKVCDITA